MKKLGGSLLSAVKRKLDEKSLSLETLRVVHFTFLPGSFFSYDVASVAISWTFGEYIYISTDTSSSSLLTSSLRYVVRTDGNSNFEFNQRGLQEPFAWPYSHRNKVLQGTIILSVFIHYFSIIGEQLCRASSSIFLSPFSPRIGCSALWSPLAMGALWRSGSKARGLQQPLIDVSTARYKHYRL